jgi:hypothetical protein
VLLLVLVVVPGVLLRYSYAICWWASAPTTSLVIDIAVRILRARHPALD